MRSAFLVLLLSTSTLGCGEEEPDDSGAAEEDDTGADIGAAGMFGSCVHPSEHCTEYRGASWEGRAEGYCDGAWSTDPCDRTDAVGYCIFDGGAEDERWQYYYPVHDVPAQPPQDACDVNDGEYHPL